ncbi:Uncharacterized protein conserved in archaea [Archaeoglobus sulfaticallidus PM70-1]|uniref:Uncharacterized protein conserved in archaea n=1 Tax=Archaeoglobus sulfaticallidus PM70-1 TaxID=387631 RepID=N0BFQ9_9EURY|nr:DUF1152 domain-containing protein [Archaeoglobus sulfaticallidus]AGK61863.1 Uncharacterized protein conserved in archaea [Archaeoglobus sulfaticallidus PM70-1]
MNLFRLLKSFDTRKAVVFGMGGGGDIVATVPTANLMREFGFEVLHGTIVWDRYIIDPEPGPRAIEDLENVEIVNDTIAIASEKTRIGEIIPTVARAGRCLGKVVALDITKGPKRLAEGLKAFMDENNIAIAVGIDSGGDVLASGFESGVRSPLADAISLATLSLIENSFIGFFGFGSDGELRIEELLMKVSSLIKENMFLGSVSMSDEDYREMMELTKNVVTEASSIPLRAYEGELGVLRVRAERSVPVSPLSIMTFYFKTEGVFKMNKLAKTVLDVESIDVARKRLNEMGIFTEMDFEYLVKNKNIPWD